MLIEDKRARYCTSCIMAQQLPGPINQRILKGYKVEMSVCDVVFHKTVVIVYAIFFIMLNFI